MPYPGPKAYPCATISACVKVSEIVRVRGIRLSAGEAGFQVLEASLEDIGYHLRDVVFCAGVLRKNSIHICLICQNDRSYIA